jgi:hypothetical protein
MGGTGGLSTSISRPSEFITSVRREQEGDGDTTQLTASLRNTLLENKPRVFRPSYSHQSENWREEITFKNAASAEAHYGKGGLGQAYSNPDEEEQEIEMPYRYTAAEAEVETEEDPDDTEEEVVSTSSFYLF